MRVLLAVTTANQIAYNRQAFMTIMGTKPDFVDAMVVDDSSNDGTVQLARDLGLDVVTKDQPRGHIDSLNIAYRRFRAGDYDRLILANNDILVPPGAIHNLCAALERDTIVSPMSTLKGVGHQPGQAVRQHYPELPLDETEPSNCRRVQEYVDSQGTKRGRVVEVPYVNSFVIGMNRRVTEFELQGGLIFDPRNVNVGNEDELCQRVVDRKCVCVDSFIFHYKGVTLELTNLDGVPFDLNVNREMLWNEAVVIRQSPLRRFFYRVRRRLTRILSAKSA